LLSRSTCAVIGACALLVCPQTVFADELHEGGRRLR
jgi:hypothetical protein